MSYYDGQVAYFDNQIRSNRQFIDEYNYQIKKIEDDIEDLRRIKNKVNNVDSAMTTAVDGTSSKISNLPALITNPFSFLKTNFFASFLDVLKGSEHTKAKRGIESANQKISNKIGELQREIERLRAEIGRCNSNVNFLTRQKGNYIADKEASEREAALKNACSTDSTKK